MLNDVKHTVYRLKNTHVLSALIKLNEEVLQYGPVKL